MPKLRKEKKNEEISAVFADDVAIRTYRNQKIVSKIRRPKKSKSVKREKSNERFAEATAWAKAVLKDADIKKLYSKGINENLKNAATVARRDYLKGPTIHYISVKELTGAIGDKIRIKATDNFQVTSVDVVITDKKGKEIEKGAAEKYKRKPQMWIYTLTVDNLNPDETTIKVTAKDRPGNVAVKEEKVEFTQLPAIVYMKATGKKQTKHNKKDKIK